METIQELNDEIKSLQDDLKTERRERMMAMNQAAEMRRTLERVQIEMRKQEHYRSEVKASKDAASNQVSNMQKQAAELKSRYALWELIFFLLEIVDVLYSDDEEDEG